MENLGLNRFQAVLDQVSHNHVSVMTVAVYGGLTVDACVIAYLDEIPKTKLRQGIYYHFKIRSYEEGHVGRLLICKILRYRCSIAEN